MPEPIPNNVRLEKLTKREQRFAEEYLLDLNAYQAAIRAGYSASTARDACKWINDDYPERPRLAAYIKARMADRARREEANADRILREIIRIAMLNPADVIDTETGKIRSDAKLEDLAAIESVCVQNGRKPRFEVRFHSKIKAIELAGKMLGMFDSKQAAGDKESRLDKLDNILRAIDDAAKQ